MSTLTLGIWSRRCQDASVDEFRQLKAIMEDNRTISIRSQRVIDFIVRLEVSRAGLAHRRSDNGPSATSSSTARIAAGNDPQTRSGTLCPLTWLRAGGRF